MAISTFNGLNVALRGLLAQQRALDVTSHNIANASTEGYTRQEAVLGAEAPLANVSVWGMIFPGQLGQGVTVEGYRRIRDVFTDASLRGSTSHQESVSVTYDQLANIASTLPEQGGNGLKGLLTQFWASWQNVANTPENLAARQALAEQSNALAAAIRSAATALHQQRLDADAQMGDSTTGIISQVNAIGAQIALLNDQIGKAVEAGATFDPATLAIVKPGQAPNDLLDRRDKLLDDLAKLVNISSVTYDDRQRATIAVAGLTLVAVPAGATTLTRNDIDTAFAGGGLKGGQLQGLEDSYANLLDESDPNSYASQLNALALALHDEINTRHAQGDDLNGNGGGQFWDLNAAPWGGAGAAARLTVDAGILADPRTIAVATAGQGPGSSGNALNIVAARDAALIGGATIDTAYDTLITSSRTAAQTTKRDLDSTAIVVNSLKDRRDAASGVSLDEEMTNMVRFQHAYSAAARVLSAMDDNLSKLINSTGRVGL